MILPEGEISKQSLLLSEYDVDGSEGSSKTSASLRLVSSPFLPLSPPGYLETRRPKTLITYTFFPQTIPANSMIMRPPSYVKNTLAHPSYYISVNMNCFTPSSYITTIRRDGWESEVMGDFEMGISACRKHNTVFFRGYERSLTEMLESSSKFFRGASYLWKRHSEESPLDLYWEESALGGVSILSCFFGKEKMTTNSVAEFIPASLSRRPGRNKPDFTRLQVNPQGHDFLDDIVISVLIIERIRTLPSILKDIPCFEKGLF